jgi:choice-of-anchor A domain-containing protein
MASLLSVILVVAAVFPAWAACPQNLVDCYGAAAAFSIVSGKVMLSKGSFGEFGEGISIYGASVGDTCAPRAFVGGGYGCITSIDNLILTEPSGIAAKFSTFLCNDYPDYPGFDVPGDIVTGGGTLSGATDMIRVQGIIDTTGLDPRVDTCAQALIDMRTASATLAALTPTRDLGAVRSDPDDNYSVTLTADPGVNVWTAREFSARSKHHFLGYDDSSINIALDPATESVVINTRKVSVGTWSSINVFGGDLSKVVFNLPERGTVKTDGYIDPAILAPDGKVIVRFNGAVGPAYARRVTVLGGYAY